MVHWFVRLLLRNAFRVLGCLAKFISHVAYEKRILVIFCGLIALLYGETILSQPIDLDLSLLIKKKFLTVITFPFHF